MTDDQRPAWAVRLQAEREARGWGKAEMARQLFRAAGITNGNVRNLSRQITGWEAGDHFPRDWARFYCIAFDIPHGVLFGDGPAAGHEALTPSARLSARRMDRMTPARIEAVLSHLNETWHMLVRADNVLGPVHAVQGVLLQLDALVPLLKVARPPQRDAALRLAAQYAESAAWLYEDSGDLTASRTWTGRAMEWAVEAGDTSMVAWVLFRRSQQATTAPEMLGLAEAARREQRGEPSPMLAAILQQLGHAHAYDREEGLAFGTLDQARQFAVVDEAATAEAGHGSFCSTAYLDMQRGRCWSRLGKPARAVPEFTAALNELPAAYQRDRGVGYAGLAAALLATGEPDQAARAADEALVIAEESGSARIMGMVTTVAAGLSPHRNLEPVADLLAHLADGPDA